MRISPVSIYTMPKNQVIMSSDTKNRINLHSKESNDTSKKLTKLNLKHMSSMVSFSRIYSGYYDVLPLEDKSDVKKENVIKTIHRYIDNVDKGFANTGLNHFLRSFSISIAEKDPETQETRLVQGNTIQDIIDILSVAYDVGNTPPFSGVCETMMDNVIGTLGELFYDDVQTMVDFSKLGIKSSKNNNKNVLRVGQLFIHTEPIKSFDDVERMHNTSPRIIEKMSFPNLFEYIEQTELTPKEKFELLDGTYMLDNKKGQGRYLLDKYNNPSISIGYNEADMQKFRAKLFEILDTAIKEEAIPYLERSKTIQDPYRRNPNAVSVIRMLDAYADFIPEDRKQEYEKIKAMFLPEVPERCKNSLTDETAYL